MDDFERINEDRKASRIARAYVAVLIWTCAAFAVVVTLGLLCAIIYFGGASLESIALNAFTEPGVMREVMPTAGYVLLVLMVLVRLPRMLLDDYSKVQRYLSAIQDDRN